MVAVVCSSGEADFYTCNFQQREASLVPGFERRASESAPHYEVWYGKVDIEPGVALWFRYTILDGETREASTWAVLFSGGTTVGGRGFFQPEDLAEPNVVIFPNERPRERFAGRRQVFHISDDIHLDEANAIGTAGEVSWDLCFEDSGRRFRYLPHALFDLGIAGSTYDACFLDLRVSGEVKSGEETYTLEGHPGMIGHIQGKKVIATRWGWAHCNSFDNDPDAVFEGLSAKVLVAGMKVGPLSEFVLYTRGQRYAFDTPLSLARAETDFDRDRWTFETTCRGVTLRGEATAPRRSDVALVEYTDTDDTNLWCYNSKLADLTLNLSDPKRGVETELTASGTSAYEFVTRQRPTEDVLI